MTHPYDLGGDYGPVPVVPNIDAEIYRHLVGGNGTLKMSTWHAYGCGYRCATCHCRAGWAIHVAGDAGYDLEEECGPQLAGALIYQASRPGQPIPSFFTDEAAALADIRACAIEQGFAG
jgi:hypothetical protein